MHKAQEQVREFHRGMKQPRSPAMPEIRMGELRAELIFEEAMETVEALVGTEKLREMVGRFRRALFDEVTCGVLPKQPDLVKAIDGLCDTIVVSYGTAEVIGVDLEPFYDEVHRSNMAKLGGPVREDGKQLKPPGWTPPDIEGVLAAAVRDWKDHQASMAEAVK